MNLLCCLRVDAALHVWVHNLKVFRIVGCFAYRANMVLQVKPIADQNCCYNLHIPLTFKIKVHSNLAHRSGSGTESRWKYMCFGYGVRQE